MAKSALKKKEENGIVARLPKIYMCIIFLLMVYAMFIGFKMSNILSAGGTIPPLLKAAHSHTLLIAVLLLFPAFDLRARVSEEGERISGRALELALGTSIIGLALIAAGFSVAGLYPAMAKTGLSIAYIGEVAVFLAFFAYALAALAEEMYK